MLPDTPSHSDGGKILTIMKVIRELDELLIVCFVVRPFKNNRQFTPG